MEVTNLLNLPIHVFEFVNNAVAGGVIIPSVTGGTRTTGGFAVATASNNGVCTVTWSAYSGTPVIVAWPIGADSNATNASWANPFGIGPSSAGFVFANISTTNGNVVTNNFSAMVYVYGNNTGSRIT